MLLNCIHTVPPEFIEPPLDTTVNSNSATLTCKVRGYPQPTIMWYHSGRNVAHTINRNKYRTDSETTNDAPFVVESTLTIMDLTSEDSGEVSCVAMVTPDDGEPHESPRTSQLSVLGECSHISMSHTRT